METASNPFSTRAIRPGAREYRFADESSCDALVRRLAELGWRAQILGPHGTGKSTLLQSLVAPVVRAGRKFELVTLTQGQRWWRASTEQLAGWNSDTLVVIDGYEQLNAWSRWRLRAACRKRGAGLLVTSHQDVGFPTLYETSITVALARQIVADMQAGGAALVGPEDVADRLDARGGNFREAMFDFYDLYELRRSRAGA